MAGYDEQAATRAEGADEHGPAPTALLVYERTTSTFTLMPLTACFIFEICVQVDAAGPEGALASWRKGSKQPNPSPSFMTVRRRECGGLRPAGARKVGPFDIFPYTTNMVCSTSSDRARPTTEVAPNRSRRSSSCDASRRLGRGRSTEPQLASAPAHRGHARSTARRIGSSAPLAPPLAPIATLYIPTLLAPLGRVCSYRS